MTALQILAEFRQAGGRLIPEGDGLRWESPVQPPPRLIEGARQRKRDLLVLLAKPEGRCPAAHPGNYWQDPAGQWHCMECEPSPTQHRLRGVTLETLGNRAISLVPPVGDLPARGSWAILPSGAAAELVLYRDDGGEVLMRHLGGERLAWFKPEALMWEVDWPWADAAPQPARTAAAGAAGTMCATCRALRWGSGGSRCDCTHPTEGGHAPSCTCTRCGGPQ
ncbi:MAG TPA: hypothetical protein VNF74_16235 [Terriglobales bacterium]|nr:hypothetical protein [Terriglobales bacterium]